MCIKGQAVSIFGLAKGSLGPVHYIVKAVMGIMETSMSMDT